MPSVAPFVCGQPMYGMCTVFVSIPRTHATAAEWIHTCQYIQRSSTTVLIPGQYYFGKAAVVFPSRAVTYLPATGSTTRSFVVSFDSPFFEDISHFIRTKASCITTSDEQRRFVVYPRQVETRQHVLSWRTSLYFSMSLGRRIHSVI